MSNDFLINDEQFIKYYRKSFDSYIMKNIDVSKYDQMIKSIGISVPVVDDIYDNSYRRYSTLPTDYFYLRNKVKIDNLTGNELQEMQRSLSSDKELDEEFILRTYDRVLFEEGDLFLYNYDNLDYKVPSKSLVFEFAYDVVKIDSTKDYIIVKDKMKEIADAFCLELQNKTNIACSNEFYLELPKVYGTEEASSFRI